MPKIKYIKFTDTAYEDSRAIWIDPKWVVYVSEHPNRIGSLIGTAHGDMVAVHEDPAEVFRKLDVRYD
jgi:hypothetical protein